ncbi:MAG: hypothetical protein HQL69_15125 [Magnetococcales bacterium]|nr:hypothetical protein [Magnetococcales bacterium]
MSENDVIDLAAPEKNLDDPVTELLRQGAKKLLSQAIEVELLELLEKYQDLKDFH